MEKNLKDMSKYIPIEELEKLTIEEYLPGETVIDLYNNSIAFIVRGRVYSIRYQNGNRAVFPRVFREGEIIGFLKHLCKRKNWEFIALTPLEVLVVPEDLVRRYILDDPLVFKEIVEDSIEILENGFNCFYILGHGGAKACLAFLLYEAAEEDVVYFERYECFSEILGISKSMLHRITRELCSRKVIKKERKRVIIMDPERLKSLFSEYIYY